MRGVAIGVVTFACALHAFWRNGGVYLNSIFGVVKIAILVAIFAVGAAYAGGQFDGGGATANANLNIHNSTAHAGSSPYGYAEAFLAILFAFGGFNQASYVSSRFLLTGTLLLTRHRY
jgi:amino acid transporter